MPRCLIGLGSNLGNRRETLEEALAKLRRAVEVGFVSASSFHETGAVGGPANQPPFLNAAVVFDSSLQPDALLQLLNQIESEAGRRREELWGPRTLDLDLLLYGEAVLSTPVLEVPHPRMAWRRFVLEAAAEVAGEMRHPIIGWTIARLLEHLNTAMPYVAVTGAIAAGKTHLARTLCEKTSARLISEALDEKSLEMFYANPSGQAWARELEFLGQRTELLSAAGHSWTDCRPAVSDFWFDQSVAFARAWLSESQWPVFYERWRQSRERVVQPKLLVVLDAPAEVLFERIRHRGRHGEQYIKPEQLERIRQSILDQASQPDLGPVLKVKNGGGDAAITEVLAAMKAME